MLHLHIRRKHQSCVVLKNSNGTDIVLAVGGYDGTAKTDVAIYDVMTDTWTPDDSTPTVRFESINKKMSKFQLGLLCWQTSAMGFGIATDDGKKAYFYVGNQYKLYKYDLEAAPGSKWVYVKPLNKGSYATYTKYTNGL